MNTIITTTPRLHEVKAHLTNLTDAQARFLRGVIAILSEYGPTLELLQDDRCSMRMDRRTGEAFVLPDSEPHHGLN